jgi:hypothetical protein
MVFVMAELAYNFTSTQPCQRDVAVAAARQNGTRSGHLNVVDPI